MAEPPPTPPQMRVCRKKVETVKFHPIDLRVCGKFDQGIDIYWRFGVGTFPDHSRPGGVVQFWKIIFWHLSCFLNSISINPKSLKASINVGNIPVIEN